MELPAEAKLRLQEEVERLREELSGEIEVKKVLQCAGRGGGGGQVESALSPPLLPFKVQMLLAEIAVVEDEIERLETKIYEMKLDVYRQKQENRERRQRQRKFNPNRIRNKDSEILSTPLGDFPRKIR
ncbi:hypothetical protein M569_00458 [Genlisea aurea]|uniref:Ternary complex factor MIP1 leucine-zipper domain-containing protein n=1 Tax=Genlisea aurea TaxID=192259 RepID=S8END0_9LAMI|nr:hypothetical protein M569_00458 [Genlisea aurea]